MSIKEMINQYVEEELENRGASFEDNSSNSFVAEEITENILGEIYHKTNHAELMESMAKEIRES